LFFQLKQYFSLTTNQACFSSEANGASIGKYEQQLKPEVVPYFISLSSKDFIRCRQPAPFPLSLDLLLLALL